MIDPRFDGTWEDALDLAVRLGITHIEVAGGGHVTRSFLDPIMLAHDHDQLARFRDSIASRGLQIAALGCYGNPIHPDKKQATAARDDFVSMCRLAAKLDVRRVAVISGVPAGGPDDRVPNWIVPSIRPEWGAAYEWQWHECAIPYWREACQVAAAQGIIVCMEPLGGAIVYNGQTLLRLREACGENLRAILDPSQVWWMGIDPIVLVEQLGGAIGYVHAKDAALDRRRIERDGVLPACSYSDWDARSWQYRAAGYGHGDGFWRDFFTALRRAGYDGVVSVELEENYMSTNEALEKSLQTVRAALPREPIPSETWFDRSSSLAEAK